MHSPGGVPELVPPACVQLLALSTGGRLGPMYPGACHVPLRMLGRTPLPCVGAHVTRHPTLQLNLSGSACVLLGLRSMLGVLSRTTLTRLSDRGTWGAGCEGGITHSVVAETFPAGSRCLVPPTRTLEISLLCSVPSLHGEVAQVMGTVSWVSAWRLSTRWHILALTLTVL